MPNKLFHPLNPAQNKPWDDAATFFVERSTTETPAQVASRVTTNPNAAPRYTYEQLLALGSLVSNPNAAGGGGSGSGNAFQPVAGPAWLNARYTYNSALRRLDIEVAGEEVDLKFMRADGVALAGSNPDLVPLQSGTFYGAGGLSGQGAYTQQWAFGKNNSATSGIPVTSLTLTFMRSSDGALFSVTFTPVDGVRQPLINATAATQPAPGDTGWGEDTDEGDSFLPEEGTSLPVTGPTWLNARYSYNSTLRRLDIEAASGQLELRFARADGVALAGSNPDGVSLASGTFYGSGGLAGQGAYTQQWAFGKNASATSGIGQNELALTFKKADGTLFTVTFTPVDGVQQPLITAGSTTTAPPNSDFTNTTDPTDRSNVVETEYYESQTSDDGGTV